MKENKQARQWLEYPELRERFRILHHVSGLEIWLDYKEIRPTACYLLVRFGSWHRRLKIGNKMVELPAGTAHFLEHKMFEDENGEDSLVLFSELGVDANAYTSAQRTCYQFFSTDHFEESLEILFRQVTQPHFTEESLSKERKIIAEEIRSYADMHDYLSYMQLVGHVLDHHPERDDCCGSEESIERITPDILYWCHKKFYHPNNLILSVCGRREDLDEDRILALTDRYFGTEPDRTRTPVRMDLPESTNLPKRSDTIRTQMDVSRTFLTFGWKLPRPKPASYWVNSTETCAMELLMAYLFSPSAELFSRLYEKQLLQTEPEYQFIRDKDFLLVCLQADCDPDRLRPLCLAIERGMKRVLAQGISEQALKPFKRTAVAEYIKDYDSTDCVAENMALYASHSRGLQLYVRQIQRISAAMVQKLLDELLQTPHTLSLIEPKGAF